MHIRRICSKMPRLGLMPWINRKIVDPLIQILRRGAEPNQLAFSAALGITLGVFPICGVTVLLCGIAIAMLGNLCHAPSVMLANFVATPIELSLVVPFLRFGEVISGSDHFPLTSDTLREVVTGQASREVLLSIFHALLGWLIATPFILGMLYVFFLPCFKYLVHKFTVDPSSPRQPHPCAEINIKAVYLEVLTVKYSKINPKIPLRALVSASLHNTTLGSPISAANL